MKPVMYHYVRPNAPGLPHFPFLHLAHFERQLDHFAQRNGFVSREAFVDWIEGGPAPEGVLLTFDDGLRDHVEFVLPVLRARGLFALFYVPSGPATTGELLDVHKVHLVLGRLGGEATLAVLEANAPEFLPPPPECQGSATHYATQRSDEATKVIKHLFNWQLSGSERGEVLDKMLDHAFAGSPPDWRDFYLDEAGVRLLVEAGMGVGAHSHDHVVPRMLDPEQQRREVQLSCDFIETVGGSRSWGYCYPHGSRDALTVDSERAVAQAGCPFAFAVEASDIEVPLAESARYTLPRHNCNAFPHGSVSYGAG